MDSSERVTDTTRRARTVLALTLVAVVVASVAVGTVSAANSLDSVSIGNVEIGEPNASQTVNFDINLNASESTSVTIDTGTALDSTDSTVTGASEVSVTTGFDVTNLQDGDGAVTLDVTETEDNGGTATVQLTFTVDTSSQSTTVSGLSYTITDSGGAPQGSESFALLDTFGPAPTGATTGDSASGSSTARDKVTVSFKENGTGIDPTTVEAGDFSVTGAAVTGAAVDGADEVVLTLDSDLSPDATPDVTVGDLIADKEGNEFRGDLSSVTKTATDGLSPRQTGWAYDDGDGDGRVDFIRVDFSEDVSASTFDAGNWTVTDSGDPNLSNPTNPNLPGTTRLYLNVTADPDVTGTQTGTVDSPRVEYSGTSVVDAAGNEAPTQTEGYKDVADPVVKSAESLDTDADGQVDRLDVTFTEQISSGQSSSASASDFTIGGTDAGSVTKGSLAVPGDGPTVELDVTGPADDTALSLTLDYGASTIRRDGSNIANQFTGETVDDGAAPLVTGATTLDRDGDGDVDAATLSFTESLVDSTVTASDFNIGGTAADAVDTLATADDDTIQLRITTDADEVSGTDAKEVTHSTGTTADAAGNTLGAVGSGDVSESDGAAPVVTGFSLAADGEDDELDVSFDASESLSAVSVSISGPESATLSSFSQSGSTYDASVAVETNGDYTATLDTADDAAGNSLGSAPSDTATVSFVATAASNSGRDRGSNALSALSGTSSKVRVTGSTGLSEVGVSFGGAAAGTVRATEVSSFGENAPPGTFVSATDITVPDSLTETASTLNFAISRERLVDLGVDASQLTVYRLHDGSWERLETRIVDRGDDTIVVEADTPGFSRFAVMAGGASGSTKTATSTSAASGGDDGADGAGESSDESTTGSSGGDGADSTATQVDGGQTNGTETSTQTPGFGVGVALVALLSVLALASRRHD